MRLNVATKFVAEEPSFVQAVTAGFGCAEFWLNEAWLLDYKTIVERGQRFPLSYGLHFPNKPVSDQAVASAIALYRELGCKSMVIHEPIFRRHGEALLALEPELRLGVENHRLTPMEFEDWATIYPGLTWDVEHFWKFTHQDCSLEELLDHAREFLRKHRSRLRHVHLPGYVCGQEEHRPMYSNREFIHAMFDLFAEYEYEGLIVSETEKEFQNPQELRMDVLLYQRWLIERGYATEDAASSN